MTQLFRTAFFVTLLCLAMPTFAQTALLPAAPISPKQQQANARLVALWTKIPPHVYAWKRFTLPSVQKAIADGAEINTKDHDGNTALVIGSVEGNFALVKWLLAHGADKKDLNKALMFASIRDDMAVISRLLDAGAEVNSDEGRAALLEVSRWNDVTGVRLLVDHGANVNVTDDKGNTPLILAAGEHWPGPGDITTVKILLDGGAHVDAKGDKGATALMSACDAGRGDVVHLLVDHGADVNVQDDAGDTSILHSAASVDGKGGGLRLLPDSTPDIHAGIIRLLLSRGACINTQDKQGITALMAAAYLGNMQAVQLLVLRGADLHATNHNGATALAYAVDGPEILSDGPAVMIRFLVSRGISVNAQENNGQTALIIAANQEDKRAVSALLSQNAEVNTKDNSGNTALAVLLSAKPSEEFKHVIGKWTWDTFRAEPKDQSDIIQQLLSHGADPNLANNAGQTPLQLARAAGNRVIVKMLLAAGAK